MVGADRTFRALFLINLLYWHEHETLHQFHFTFSTGENLLTSTTEPAEKKICENLAPQSSSDTEKKIVTRCAVTVNFFCIALQEAFVA